MQNLKLPSIKNVTTGATFPGQHQANQNTSDIDLQCAFSDISRGDVLDTVGQLHFTLKTEMISNRYATFVGVKTVRALHTVSVSRNHNTVASDIPCHAAAQGDLSNALSSVITGTAQSDKIRDKAELIEHLIAATKLIEDSATDLQQILQTEIDQHSQSIRIILKSGSGVAVGDAVTATGHDPATVVNIDRAAYPGLEVVNCRPGIDQVSDPAAVKPSLFQKLTGS